MHHTQTVPLVEADDNPLQTNLAERKPSIPNRKESKLRRKQLLTILEKVVGTTAIKRESFLEDADLERFQGELQFDLSQRDFCFLLVKTLENAGINPETGKSALYSLLQELLERRGEGHPDEAEFLQAWMDEIG